MVGRGVQKGTPDIAPYSAPETAARNANSVSGSCPFVHRQLQMSNCSTRSECTKTLPHLAPEVQYFKKMNACHVKIILREVRLLLRHRKQSLGNKKGPSTVTRLRGSSFRE